MVRRPRTSPTPTDSSRGGQPVGNGWFDERRPSERLRVLRSIRSLRTSPKVAPGIRSLGGDLGFTYSSSSTGCYGSGGGSVSVSYGSWDRTRATKYFMSVRPGGTYTVTFHPGRRGTHSIEYINSPAFPSGGTIRHCWRAGTGTYSCWATDPVRNQYRRTNLWSGSADINYQFTFTNTTTASVEFGWRFYTGWTEP